MKLSSRILFNVLLLTVSSSVFAGTATENFIAKLKANKVEIGVDAGFAAAGAFLMYLATNEKVKAYTQQTAENVSNFTQAKCLAIANYWRNLSKNKKIATAAVAGAAYAYFRGPGTTALKVGFATPAPTQKV